MNSQKVLSGKDALDKVFHLMLDCLTIAWRQPLNIARKYVTFPYIVIGVLVFLFYITKTGPPKRTPRMVVMYGDYGGGKKLALYPVSTTTDFSTMDDLQYPDNWRDIGITSKGGGNRIINIQTENSEDNIQQEAYEKPVDGIQVHKPNDDIEKEEKNSDKLIDDGKEEKSEESIVDIQVKNPEKQGVDSQDKQEINSTSQETKETFLKEVSVLIREAKTKKQETPITMTAPFLLNNPTLCPLKTFPYVVMVYSFAENFENRLTIRNTWGNKIQFPQGRVVFLLGTQDNLATQKQVSEEFKKYGDIVQGNFQDNYKNLTLKGLMGFRWIAENCSYAKAVIKTDDNIIFNVGMFFQRLLPLFDNYPYIIIGIILENNTMPIIRDAHSKWYVPETEPLFAGRKQFPKYVSRLWVGLSVKLVQKLYLSAFNTPFFWIDDVYLFGILPSEMKSITYVNIGQDIVDCDEAIRCYNNGTTHCPILMTACNFKNVNKVNFLWNLMDKQRINPSTEEQISIKTDNRSRN